MLTAAVIVTAACSAERGAPEPAADGPPCVVEPTTEWPTGVVEIPDEEPLCDLAFVEIAALRGTDGLTSRRPIAPLPGGGYVTATYQDGILARWSADGALLDTLGRGPGDGPGEFEWVLDLVVDSAGVINVLMGGPYWHRYTLDGAFLETVDAPLGAASGVALQDGGLVVTDNRPVGEQFLVAHEIAGAGGRVIGPSLVTGAGFERIAPAASGDAFWSAERAVYEVRHHRMPEGDIDLTVRRTPSWWRDRPLVDLQRGNLDASVRGFTVDDDGILWSSVGVEHPDLPERSGPIVPSDPPEDRNDAWVEAFTVDGRLLASRFYELSDDRHAPRPFAPGLFYIRDEGPLGFLRVLEPRLIAREGRTN